MLDVLGRAIRILGVGLGGFIYSIFADFARLHFIQNKRTFYGYQKLFLPTKASFKIFGVNSNFFFRKIFLSACVISTKETVSAPISSWRLPTFPTLPKNTLPTLSQNLSLYFNK